MTKTPMHCRFNHRDGFTLIELLVAISIMTIVIALIVPRLRIVNKDRNIRETARVIGAKFASARDQATLGGSGGIVIERNLGFVTRTARGNRVYFAGTRLTELKATPPYAGDSEKDFAFVVLVNNPPGNYFLRCFIPAPFEHDPASGKEVIRPNDVIRFGNASTRYRIRNVLPVVDVTFSQGMSIGTMSITVCGYDLGGNSLPMLPLDLDFQVAVDSMGNPNLVLPDYYTNFPAPPLSLPIVEALNVLGPYSVAELACHPSFVIERRPRRIQSSTVDLPAGYFIDLRYSGPLDQQVDESIILSDGMDDPDTNTLFGLAIDPMDVDPQNPISGMQINREIEIHFDGSGAIDRIYYNGLTQPLSQSIYLYVDEFDPTDFIADEPSLSAAQKALANDASLWVTIGANGGTNIGYNTPPVVFTNVPQMINDARIISRDRTSASQ